MNIAFADAMRILWLKSDLLLPLDKGGKLRTWHLMRHLTRRHAITYLSFAEPGQPRADLDGMREVAERVITIPRRHPVKRSLRFYAGAARYVVDPLPYAVGRHRSARYRREVVRLLSSDTFDIVVCDFLPPVVNLPTQLPCPAVLFTHNVEAEIWRRHAESQTTAIGRWLYAAQCRRMLRFEGRTLVRFDGVLAVSESDSSTFSRLYPTAARRPIRVVPTGVDTQYFAAEAPSRRESRQLVFTGSMDWLPNEDAVLFFCRSILPHIRAQEPETTFSIVGRAPTPAVRALAALPGVTVTGRVPDIRPHVREAAVVVVPLRIGGGTRLKIFEAMAMGRVVVSTPVGAEGLSLTNGTELLVAHDPADFAHAVVRLLRDPDLRAGLASAAQARVVNHFDWSCVAGALEDALVEFAASPPVVQRIEGECPDGKARTSSASPSVRRSLIAIPSSIREIVPRTFPHCATLLPSRRKESGAEAPDTSATDGTRLD